MIRLFSVFFPSSQVALVLIEVVLTFTCYLLASLWLFEIDPFISLLYEGGLQRALFVTATVILGIYFNDLYDDMKVRSRLLLVQKYCLSIGIAFLAQALVGYARFDLSLPRWQMIAGSSLALVLLPALRIGYWRMVLQGTSRDRVLFLGTSDLLREVAAGIEARPQFGVHPSGYLDDAPLSGAPAGLGPHLGTIDQVIQHTRDQHVSLIVTGLSERRGKLPVLDLLDLRLSGIRVEDAATMCERVFGRISVSALRPSELIYSSQLGPNHANLLLRDLYSFVVALVALVIASPIMLLVALLVRFSSPGPSIYRQKRVGVNNSEFWLYKFRSMVATAEQGTGAQWAARNDPRVTPLGKWLRLLRLDELPQLFNVLRGDMAIVGPRPERPEFVKTLSGAIPFYRQRHCVKPGITGWAQINHHYSDSVEDTVSKIEYDLYYIKHVSPMLDAYIIFQTAKVMLLQRGSR